MNNESEHDFVKGQSEGNALNTSSERSNRKKLILEIPKVELRNHNNNESEHEFEYSG